MLHLLVEAALADARVLWSELTAIIVSIGPGSFTGLRVGVSYAKGAALALGIPVVPVSTLSLLANTLKERNLPPGRYMPLIPARKGEAFGQMFRLELNEVTDQDEPFLVDLDTASKHARAGVLLIGEGVEQFAGQLMLENPEGNLLTDLIPSPTVLLELGRHLLREGNHFPAASDIEPLYLKEFTVKSSIVSR